MAGKRTVTYYLKHTILTYTCVLFACLLVLMCSPINSIDSASIYGITITDGELSPLYVVLNTLCLKFGKSFYSTAPALSTAIEAFSHSVLFSTICLLSLLISSILVSLLAFDEQFRWFRQLLYYISAIPSIIYISGCFLVLKYFAIQPNHIATPIVLVVLKSLGLYIDLMTSNIKQHMHSNANLFLGALGVPKWQTLFYFSSKSLCSILLFKLPLKFLKLTYSVMLFEALLGLKGIGSLMLNAILSYDLPIICACLVLSSALTAVCMTLSDYISHTLYETKLG